MSPADKPPDFDNMSPNELMNWMDKVAKEKGAIESPSQQGRKGGSMKTIELGNIAGLRLTAHWTAFVGFVLLWAILSILAIALPLLPPLQAIVGALICTLLHYLSELWHQLGHAWAARRTGYPMIGVRYWWILGASIYPKDEPSLPGSIHIKRALGGPIASLLLALVSCVAILATGSLIGDINEPNILIWWNISLFMFLDNFFVFALGAFLPLGFTDGSTILRWWGK